MIKLRSRSGKYQLFRLYPLHLSRSGVSSFRGLPALYCTRSNRLNSLLTNARTAFITSLSSPVPSRNALYCSRIHQCHLVSNLLCYLIARTTVHLFSVDVISESG